MTLQELVLCFISFSVVSIFVHWYIQANNVDKPKSYLVLIPGLIVSNVVSLYISNPGDRLFQPNITTLTDLPIVVGFPFSFYEIGAFGDDQFYLWGLCVNIISIIFFSYMIANDGSLFFKKTRKVKKETG